MSSLVLAKESPCAFPQHLNLTLAWEADLQASWHIHSLTPLQLDAGAAPARCDRAREHDGELIISVLTSSKALGKAGIESLEGEWKEREVGEGLEETLERAWRRGGTCISALDPSCDPAQLSALFPSSVPFGADAVPYFLLAHEMYRTFDTLALLDAADINPSEEVTYSLAEIKAALAPAHPSPVILCDNTHSIQSISYPLSLGSSASTPRFAPLSVDSTSLSTCPDENVFYHPSLASRAPINRGKRVASQTWDPIYRPSPRPITLLSNPTASAEVERDAAAEPSPLKAQKLGFFGGAEKRRGRQKEAKLNEGRWGKRDEL